MCDCLQLTINTGGSPATYVETIAGTYNGVPYWVFTHNGVNIYVWSADATGSVWIYGAQLGFGIDYGRWTPSPASLCPEASLSPDPLNPSLGWSQTGALANLKQFTTIGVPCPEPNCNQEDRTKRSYDSIKLPTDFVEDDRGIKDCCCKYLVLASESGDSWKTDITSAWIKASDPSDTYAFELYKDGVLTTYTPTPVAFPNEDNAYYTTIHWIDVLNSDGAGCYELKIAYSISGISGSVSWGKYTLQPYSIQNALNTARIRAKFNAIQESEGINFTGADVESTFRFYGYIGGRNPNMQTDNIIYNNREMKRVIRENLNSYEICTDPSDECITRPLIELFLLSENELYISDYNAHNHSYRYNDIPVIVEESPEVEYYDFSRKAKVTCIVTDKVKNKRTYY